MNLFDLAFFQTELRFVLFALTIVAITMLARPAWRAINHDISGRAAGDLGLFVILLGQAAFQSGYVLEGISDSPHWRNIANIVMLIIGCVIVIAARLIKRHEARLMEEADEDGA